MKNTRHIVASIFLILFSFIQLVDLHVVGHDANDVDCKICHLSPDHLDDDFDYAYQVETPNVVTIIFDNSNFIYKSRFVNDYIYFSLQNKAPPVL